MFIFNWIANFFSIIGFILAGTIVYFGLNPISANQSKDLSLSQILNCNSVKLSFENIEDLNSDKMLDLKNKIGADLPIEIMKDATKQLTELSKSAGSRLELDLEYCPILGEKSLLASQFKTKVSEQGKSFVTGSIDDFKNEVNKLPLASLTGLSIETNTIYARSTYCNTSVNKTSIYFFTTAETKTPVEINNAVLFRIKVNPVTDVSQENKFIRNLIESGQYFKSQVYCNE